MIAASTARLSRLEQVKRGSLQAMFPLPGQTAPALRFKGFAGEWKRAAFNEIITISNKLCYDESIPSVEYEDINCHSGTLNKNIFKKDIHKLGKHFSAGDILFGKLRPYLCNYLHADFEGIAIGDFWIFKNGLALTDYVYPFIYTETFQNISNMSVGSKMPRADWSLVGESKFYFPPTKAEQEAIGAYFKELDRQLQLEGAKLGKLRQLKQASLCQLFV